jgi:hypothetical protein
MQKTTISKPNSVISGSSFSLPVNYYDMTTPYQFDGDADEVDEFDNDIRGFDDFGEELENIEDFTKQRNSSDSDEIKDVVQAFNPYVKVCLFFFSIFI